MIKIAIRQDEETNVLRAYLARLEARDVRDDNLLLATLNLSVARNCPGVFDAWKRVLQDALTHLLTDQGLTVQGFEEFRPKDKN